MDLAFLVSLAAGMLAAIGLVGIIGGASSRRTAAGRRWFRIGSIAMTIAGLAAMVAGLGGIGGVDQLFGGLMMTIFGTAVSLPKDDDIANHSAPTPTA
jgi:hypothetical protein